MSAQKNNLLTYLPPQERHRVILLIQRLQEETQAKNKLQILYAQAKTEINQLQLRCNQLKDQNTALKQQMHNSFSMIAQVRNNFRNNRQKHAEEEWQDEEDEEENQPNTSNIRQHPPKPNFKSSVEKYFPQASSAERPSPNVLNNSSFLNQSNAQSGTKRQEMEELRREVRALQLEKQKEEEKARQITEKHRLVDEIKNRYRTTQESASKRKDGSAEKIDITDTFLNEDEEERMPKSNSSLKKITSKKLEEETPHAEKKKQYDPPKNERLVSKSPNQQLPQPTQYNKPKPQPPSKSNIDEDYCDVLDLINDYNL